jgi:hypothetical protein
VDVLEVDVPEVDVPDLNRERRLLGGLSTPPRSESRL